MKINYVLDVLLDGRFTMVYNNRYGPYPQGFLSLGEVRNIQLLFCNLGLYIL